jgi:hypothetical protein
MLVTDPFPTPPRHDYTAILSEDGARSILSSISHVVNEVMIGDRGDIYWEPDTDDVVCYLKITSEDKLKHPYLQRTKEMWVVINGRTEGE